MSTPTASEMFATALRQAMDGRLEDVHVSMPGRIESYDRAHQRAVVQPLVKRVIAGEDGEQKAISYPPITDVPVEFFGGGDYSLSFPVARGMTCRLEFCSASLDKFLALGGEVDPEDPRRFSLSDAVAVLGLRDFAHALKSLPQDAWVMSCPTGSQIRLGSTGATERSILGDIFKSSHTTLVNAIATAVGTIPGGSGAASTITAALTTFNAVLWLSQTVRLRA